MNKFIVLLIAFSSFAWVPLLHPTEYYDSDEKLAPLFRLTELDRCIREGILPVRWAPDTYGGRGSPLFNFYAPLFYYLAEIPALLGFSIIWSVKIAIALLFISSGLFMFLLMREVAGDRAGFFSAVLYMYSPYLLFDVYVRGALGEALAITVSPLILFALHKKRPILGGIAYAALSVSHNPLALLFTPFLILYIGYMVHRRELSYEKAFTVIIIGLGLSAFFWLPALWEKSTVHIDWILIYDYKNSFLNINQIVLPLGHLARATVENKSSLQLGALHAVLTLSAAPLLKTNYSKFVLSLFLLSLFSITPYSAPIWNAVPLVKYVQFPWRAMAVTAFFSAILGGMTLGKLSGKLSGRLLPILGLLIVVSSLNFIGYTERIEVTNENTTAAKLMEYFDSGLTYGYEYLPRGAIVPTGLLSKKVEIKNGKTKVLELQEKCTSLEFIAVGMGDIKVNINWFPGWTALVDGIPTSLLHDSDGSMIIPLNEGTHKVLVKFGNTRVRTISNAISLFSVTLLLFLRRERRKSVERE